MKVYIGTSGWSYEHWNKVFYKGISSDKRLQFYAKHFDTVEINNTFYHLPSTKTVKQWEKTVPRSFIFSVKASRYITHIKRLKNCKASLNRLYKQLNFLHAKLGPILFQLPPSFEKNMERLEDFAHLLRQGYRYVFEFRSPTWFDEETYSFLKQKKIALCISDLEGHLSPLITPAKFVYIRLHGPKIAYGGAYGKRRLHLWAKRIKEWAAQHKKTVYLYFDNDEKGFAIQDVQTLLQLIDK